MPVTSDAVGRSLPAITVPVTARRVLAFAAGIGETSAAAFDDANPGFVASPMFCASLEWRLVTAARNRLLGVTADEAQRAVHARQDSRFQCPLAPAGVVEVAGEIISVRQTRAGALSTTRLDIRDPKSGASISTTFSSALYRDVAVRGEDRSKSPDLGTHPGPDEAVEVLETAIALDRGFAHRFSECASIWNPIHTERAVALEAGLPDIIVHGTALWALAGRTLIERFAPSQPMRLRRLSGRFSAMVVAGDPIIVRHGLVPAKPGLVIFSVLNAQGKEAVSEGVAEFSGDKLPGAEQRSLI